MTLKREMISFVTARDLRAGDSLLNADFEPIADVSGIEPLELNHVRITFLDGSVMDADETDHFEVARASDRWTLADRNLYRDGIAVVSCSRYIRREDAGANILPHEIDELLRRIVELLNAAEAKS